MEIFSGLNQFKGEIAALIAAFLWAASSIVYSFLGQTIPPLLLNLIKGSIAILLILITFVITGFNFPAVEPTTIAVLMISGAIGIGLGDTAYFQAINAMGARQTLLLETLAPPMAAVLALFFLAENLSYQAWCGILITLLGVAWVISERTQATHVLKVNLKLGLFWGFMAGVAQASGAVISRFALVESNIDPLYSTFWRLLAGSLIVLFLLILQPARKKTIPGFWSVKILSILLITAFYSTYLGIWLQQTALKETSTGIAQTLTSTSPLFVLPIAASLGEKITLRAVLGVVVALGGIALLFI